MAWVDGWDNTGVLMHQQAGTTPCKTKVLSDQSLNAFIKEDVADCSTVGFFHYTSAYHF